jgi:hypothetical protein
MERFNVEVCGETKIFQYSSRKFASLVPETLKTHNATIEVVWCEFYA